MTENSFIISFELPASFIKSSKIIRVFLGNDEKYSKSPIPGRKSIN